MEERYRSLAALKYTYDVRGRMSVVRRGTRETLLAYNAGGYLSRVTDAVGRQVTFATDALGRVTRQTMAGGWGTPVYLWGGGPAGDVRDAAGSGDAVRL
ncbi:MAG: RHS repeat protein [Elusimicrobia bacterium]|nr:RHS repeat protein [Elusimicrobiota bacterium]